MIIEIILRATRMTQGQLAEYLGVSRASVNAWVQNSNTMTNNSKDLVAEKFCFPFSFFDLNLKDNKEEIIRVYSLIKENWEKEHKDNSDMDFLNRTIDELENGLEEEKEIVFNDVSQEDILIGLCNAYNPFTGEVFNDTHILNNQKVKDLLKELKHLYENKSKFNLSKEDLNDEDKKLFEELRKWRWDKTMENNYFNAYIVFSDRELINIILAKINKKEDLLSVYGIGKTKYKMYGEELFDIIKNKKYVSLKSNKNNSFDFYSDF